MLVSDAAAPFNGADRKVVIMLLLLLFACVSEAATRRALIFGLGRQADVRWGRIHGDNDVGYVRQTLLRQGYTDIQVLKNEQATKLGMVDALMDLIARCKKGDIVYVHYSGHGQLMTDLDGDEALKWDNSHAAWDEAWIPYDAYMTYGPEDRGEKHFCDDEVALYLQAIRQRIGRRGQLTVVVDACHSGDATCGPEDEPVRGVDVKFNIPRDPRRAQATEVLREDWRAISACKPYQLSTELKDKRVGKLTYALYSIGPSAAKMSNEELQQALNAFMEQHKGRLPQTPEVRGEAASRQ